MKTAFLKLWACHSVAAWHTQECVCVCVCVWMFKCICILSIRALAYCMLFLYLYFSARVCVCVCVCAGRHAVVFVACHCSDPSLCNFLLKGNNATIHASLSKRKIRNSTLRVCSCVCVRVCVCVCVCAAGWSLCSVVFEFPSTFWLNVWCIDVTDKSLHITLIKEGGQVPPVCFRIVIKKEKTDGQMAFALNVL